ncbi:TPA: FAD-dependent oxidoreductase, partial [Pseudomonas aeruginosa]
MRRLSTGARCRLPSISTLQMPCSESISMDMGTSRFLRLPWVDPGHPRGFCHGSFTPASRACHRAWLQSSAEKARPAEDDAMRLCVIGAGYVGLVTAACFAEMGNQVRCVERDRERVARLRRGEMPIYEPGLESILRDQLDAARLT